MNRDLNGPKVVDTVWTKVDKGNRRKLWEKSTTQEESEEESDYESSVDSQDGDTNALITPVGQEWVQKKVANKGPSILEIARRNSPPHLFQGDKGIGISKENIPNIPLDYPGIILHGVLSKEECQSLKTFTPFSGTGYMSIEQVKKLYVDREVQRYVSLDDSFSKLIEDRIGSYLPRVLDGMEFAGISPEWRYLLYERGGHQGCHIDGREERGKNLVSRLTVQMYLNDSGADYDGGEIQFLKNDLTENFKHVPQAGDCIIFYQECMSNSRTPLHLMHKALNVTSGKKYALRSVVEYRLL